MVSVVRLNCLSLSLLGCVLFFFFNDTATTEIYTLSLHDALPISLTWGGISGTGYIVRTLLDATTARSGIGVISQGTWWQAPRSEEHTSELQSHVNLVCRLLLEKKKKKKRKNPSNR